MGVHLFRTGTLGCHEAAPRPRQPTDRRRSETWTLTKSMGCMSSGAAADKLISENTTGRVLRASAHRIRSKYAHRPPVRYLSTEMCGHQTAPLTGSVEIPLTGPGAGPPFRNSSRPAGTGVLFVNTGVIFCSTYYVFERVQRPRRTFYGTLKKIQNSRSASGCLISTKNTLRAVRFFGQAPSGSHNAATRP